MKPTELLSALRARYAVKAFDPSFRIPEETFEALLESLRLTPSSFGIQPWKFIVIRDAALREKLLPHSWGQKQVTDCAALVVLLKSDKLGSAEIADYVADIAATRGVEASSLDGYKGLMEGFVSSHPDIGRWAGNQVYIALGQLLLSCAALGLDACPMEGLVPEKYDEVLGLSGSGHSTVVACAIGMRSTADKYAGAAKVRFPAKKIIDLR